MAKSNCYACRNYYEDCCDEPHPKKDLKWAKHLNGRFYWGRKAKDVPGLWVLVCRYCRVALSEN